MGTIGVDAHKRVHAAVAIDEAGREIDAWRGDNTPEGWQALRAWATATAPDAVWGIEGSGQYGRGLAQLLVQDGIVVREVNPQLTAATRRGSRQQDKTDRIDALAVARIVRQEGEHLPAVQLADATAVSAVLVTEREALVAEATRVRNRLHHALSQLVGLEPAPWPSLTTIAGVTTLVTYELPAGVALTAQDQAIATVVRLQAAALLQAMTAAAQLATAIAAAVTTWSAPLQEVVGVGPLTAGMLAAHLGGRDFRSDAALASYAGVAPLQASSAATIRHRLNRTGNRQLNAIFHRIALTQSRCSDRSKAYLAKLRAAGKTHREAMRCLKRVIAREIFHHWQACTIPALADTPWASPGPTLPAPLAPPALLSKKKTRSLT